MKMKNNKLKIIIIITFILIVSSVVLAFYKFTYTKPKTEKFSTNINNVYMQVIPGWKEVEKEENYVKISHEKYDAYVEIRKSNLETEFTQCDIGEIAGMVLVNLENQYQNCNVLAREKEVINGKEFYKILLESNEYQALIVVYKENINMFISSYIASSDIFDIMLDSALTMLYDIKYLEDSFVVENLKKVETTGIEWQDGNNNIENEQKEKEIYNDSYHAIITVPKSFNDYEFSSKDFHYTYSGYSIIGSIQSKNIYEYIFSDIEDTFLEREYESLKKYYNNVIAQSEFDGERYIYLFEYNNDKTSYQDVYIVYPLDNTHVLSITISASNKVITKDLVDSIHLKEFDRYAENIVYREEKDGKNCFDFYAFDRSYSSGIYYELKLHLPKEYKEIDMNVNNLINRYFGYQYDANNDEFMNEIQTQLYHNKSYENCEEYIKNQNPLNSTNMKIEKKEDILGTNNQTFNYYELEYETSNNNKNKQMNKYIFLFLDITENVSLVSKIDASKKEFPYERIKDFTDITYEKLEY